MGACCWPGGPGRAQHTATRGPRPTRRSAEVALDRSLRPGLGLAGVVAELSPGTNAALRLQLRALLNYHCGVNTLRTRQMMRELQNL